MSKITQTEPIQVEEVIVQKIGGLVNKIEQRNAGVMVVTFTLNGHMNTPVTVEFPYAQFDTQSPIKMGDWITVTTKVEKLEPKPSS